MIGVARVSMRPACAAVIAQAAEHDRGLVALGADGRGLFEPLASRWPDRYIDVGIAESNLVSVAAGLARSGLRVVVGAMAPFLIRRAYEQLRLDVCLPGLPMTLLGVGGGLSYGALGPSHHAVDDIALMSALPGVAVYCPADANDAAGILASCLPPRGVTYVRLTAREEPVVPSGVEDGGSDTIRLLRQGGSVLVIATGRAVSEATAAADDLAVGGVPVTVAAASRLEPFPGDEIRRLCAGYRLVVTVEEAIAVGGLGQRVADAVPELGRSLVRLHVDDRLPPARPHAGLLRFYGIDGAGIRAVVRQAAARGTGT
jgi:transketolase